MMHLRSWPAYGHVNPSKMRDRLYWARGRLRQSRNPISLSRRMAEERSHVVPNGRKHPTPIAAGIDSPDIAAESPKSSQSTNTQDGALSSPAASGDDLVSAIEREEAGAIVGEGAREPADHRPLIEAIEALARGIRNELDLAEPVAPTVPMDPPGKRAVGSPVPVFGSELETLVEAVQAQLRGIRSELALAEPAARVVPGDPLSEKRAVLGPGPTLGQELGPLIEAFEAHVRRARTELGLTDPVVEQPRPSPPLPEVVPPPLADPPKETTVGGPALRFGRDAWSRRWSWVIASVGVLLVAAVVGGRLTSGGRLPTAEVARPLPAPRSVSTEKSMPTQTPLVDPPAESSQTATAPHVSVPVVPSAPGGTHTVRSSPVAGARLNVRDPAAARPGAAPREDVAVATPSLPTESSSSVGATSAPAASALPRPSESPEAVGAKAPNLGLPALPSPGRDGLAAPDRIPPVAGIAASPGAEANNSPSMSLTRPAAVLTRVRPRVLVEVLSGEMSAVVEVQVEVDSAGRPNKVRAVSGPAALRAPAEDTVAHWTFSPALQGGEPVDGALRVTLTFGPSVRDMRFRRRSR
jgi:protein TonB